jgi:hypothetical protein
VIGLLCLAKYIYTIAYGLFGNQKGCRDNYTSCLPNERKNYAWASYQRIYLLTFLEVPNSLHACNICCSSQISGRATIPRRSSLFITYAFIFIVVIQLRCYNQSNNFRIEESEFLEGFESILFSLCLIK